MFGQSQTNPKRRWFRFSLRTLLVVVAVFCGLTAWVANSWRQVRAREVLFREYSTRGAALGPVFPAGKPVLYIPAKPLPLLWGLLGAEDPGANIWLPRSEFTAAEFRHAQELFPDVEVVWWDQEIAPPTH